MFKKILVFMLALALLTPLALSESWEEPVLKNPQAAYEYYVEETDGSEQMIFGLIDFMNEELSIAEEHGAVKFYMHYIGPDGSPMITVTNYLQISDYGNLHIMEVTDLGETHLMYNIGTEMYHLFEGEIEVSSNGYTQEEADWFWNSYVFPFGNLEVLNGVRQDENGYSYFLIKSDETMTFEYVVGDSLNIEQLRVYYADGNGNLELAIIVDYDVSEAQPLPEELVEMLKETLPASTRPSTGGKA